MQNLGKLADGARGEALVKLWKTINERCFCDSLEPIPVQWVSCIPYGRCIGSIRHNQASQEAKGAARIEIMRSLKNTTAAIVLLHEMCHQWLMEAGRNPNHISIDWRAEIQRLSLDVFGVTVAAPKQIVQKYKTKTGQWTSRRVMQPTPENVTGLVVLDRKDASTWPAAVLKSPNAVFPGWLRLAFSSLVRC